ncbi:hypothetical protein [Blastomonas sp.]|uniref:hypothetical protein n=1 Tax=Blastomonas sp. TaxID=1909299 RepID=UPI00359445B8
MTNSYIAIDCEFSWDEALHQAHLSFDPTSKKHATAVKRVMAASAFEFSIDDEGRVSTGPVVSWNEFDWGGEKAVIEQLFDYLRARPSGAVLSYGGLAVDIPVLLLAAMEYGIRLPDQLLDQPGRRGPRPHVDLGLQLKGGGRTWSHLSQVLLRIGVPVELVRDKPSVLRPCQPKAWQNLADHVELDVLLLAIAKVAWRVSQGAPVLRLEPAIIALIGGFLRQRRDHRAASLLRKYAADLENRYGAQLAIAA